MLGAIAVLLTTIIAAGTACAGDGNGYRHHLLLLNSEELFRFFESPSVGPHSPRVKKTYDAFFDHLDNDVVSLRPFFTLIPSKPKKDGEHRPPTFALVARAADNTIVSLTRPEVTPDPDEGLFLQRTIVSGFDNRRFSVSVYEDHALDGEAMRFVGIGGRLMTRPSLRIFGWGLRLQLFGSFHPKYGATAYFAVTGSPKDGDPLPHPDPIE